GGQARIDGAGRRRVKAIEAILQQADELVAVTGTLIQQLEQIEPQVAVTEDAAHRAAPTGRSRATFPETVRTVRSASPRPTAPESRRPTGPRRVFSRSKAESMRPESERTSTRTLGSSSSLRATRPD